MAKGWILLCNNLTVVKTSVRAGGGLSNTDFIFYCISYLYHLWPINVSFKNRPSLLSLKAIQHRRRNDTRGGASHYVSSRRCEQWRVKWAWARLFSQFACDFGEKQEFIGSHAPVILYKKSRISPAVWRLEVLHVLLLNDASFYLKVSKCLFCYHWTALAVINNSGRSPAGLLPAAIGKISRLKVLLRARPAAVYKQLSCRHLIRATVLA